MQKFIAWLGSLSWLGPREAPQPSSSPPTHGQQKASAEMTEAAPSRTYPATEFKYEIVRARIL
jgi:hypothetical protein